jgi:hypothetical protein
MLVKDNFRKNELSLEPGGSVITAILESGRSLSYDKIKKVDAYCKKLKTDLSVVEILVDNKSIWKRNS